MNTIQRWLKASLHKMNDVMTAMGTLVNTEINSQKQLSLFGMKLTEWIKVVSYDQELPAVNFAHWIMP